LFTTSLARLQTHGRFEEPPTQGHCLNRQLMIG